MSRDDERSLIPGLPTGLFGRRRPKPILATAPPPSPGTLPWKPANYIGGNPKLASSYSPQPTVITMTNAVSGGITGSGRDLLILCTESIRNKELSINGARHVTIIGYDGYWDYQRPDANNTTAPAEEHRLIKFIGCTGTVHIEGAYLHALNNGVVDAIVWGGNANSGAPGQIAHIVNTRIDHVANLQDPTTGADIYHSDGTQLQVGTYLTGFKMYSCTYRGTGIAGTSNMHGVFCKEESGSDHVRGVDIQRCNFVGFDHNVWQQDSVIDMNTVNVYLQAPARQTWCWPQPGNNPTDGNTFGQRIATLTGGTQGGVITFNAATHWTGSMTVELSQVTPDFQPASSCGLAYVSPGYSATAL